MEISISSWGDGRMKRHEERSFFILQKYILKNFKGEVWYITHDLSAEDGIIRSISEGDAFVPQQSFQYLDPPNIDVRCTTVR